MCLFLETLTSTIRTGQSVLVELIDLVNLTQVINLPTLTPDCDSHSPAFLIYLFLLMLVFVIQWLSLHWEILIILLSQFQLIFHKIHYGMPYFTAQLMTILVLIGTVIVILSEMFHESISLNSVLLLLLVNFVSEFWLELMYISLIVSIRSSCSHLHGFQLLVKLPVHKNHYFHLHHQNKFSEAKVKFRQVSNHCKRVLEAATLAYANKTRVHHFPETWLPGLWVNFQQCSQS